MQLYEQYYITDNIIYKEIGGKKHVKRVEKDDCSLSYRFWVGNYNGVVITSDMVANYSRNSSNGNWNYVVIVLKD